MSAERIGSFAEFWPYSLGEYRRAGTRALHLIGTTLALGFLVVAVVQRLPWLLLGKRGRQSRGGQSTTLRGE